MPIGNRHAPRDLQLALTTDVPIGNNRAAPIGRTVAAALEDIRAINAAALAPGTSLALANPGSSWLVSRSNTDVSQSGSNEAAPVTQMRRWVAAGPPPDGMAGPQATQDSSIRRPENRARKPPPRAAETNASFTNFQ